MSTPSEIHEVGAYELLPDPLSPSEKSQNFGLPSNRNEPEPLSPPACSICSETGSHEGGPTDNAFGAESLFFGGMDHDCTAPSNSTPHPQDFDNHDDGSPESAELRACSTPTRQKRKAPITNAQIRVWTHEWLEQLENGGKYPYKDKKAFHLLQSDGSVKRVEVPISLDRRYASGLATERMRPIKSSHSVPTNLQKKRKKLECRIIPVLAEFPEDELRYAVFTSGPLCPSSALRKTIKLLHARIGHVFRRCKENYPLELLLIVVEPKPAEDDLGNPLFDSEGEMLFNVHANVIFRVAGPMRGKWAAFWRRCRERLRSHLHDCGSVDSVPKLVSYILKLWNFQPIIDAQGVIEFHNAIFRNPLVKTYETLKKTLGNQRKSRPCHRSENRISRRPGPKIYRAIPEEIYLGSKDRRMPDGETERVDYFMVPEARHPSIASPVVGSPYFNQYTPLTPTLIAMTALPPEVSVPSGVLNFSKTQSDLPATPWSAWWISTNPRSANETARTETSVSMSCEDVADVKCPGRCGPPSPYDG